MVMIIGCAGASFAAVPSEGLIAYYPFNGNADDESGNGNNGSVSGCALTTDRFGASEGAYFFDGVNDFIQIGSDDTIKSNYYSLCVWAKTVQTNKAAIFGAAYSTSSYSNYGYELILNNNDEMALRADHYTAATGNWGAYSSSAVNDGTWHFIVITYDGSTSKLFIDGELDASRNSSGYSSGSIRWSSSSPDFKIGQTLHTLRSGYSTYSGSLDDIRIYNRALSESEVEELYNEDGRTDCNVDITGNYISGTLQPDEDVTFIVTAENECGGDVYYRFSYHPDYGTDGYDGLHWDLMTDTEYTTDNEVTYSFPEEGKYVVMVWAVSDKEDVDNSDVPLIGFSVNIREDGPSINVDDDGDPYFPF